jgi:hypothetical protein
MVEEAHMSATMTKTLTSDDKYGKINMAGMEERDGFLVSNVNISLGMYFGF